MDRASRLASRALLRPGRSGAAHLLPQPQPTHRPLRSSGALPRTLAGSEGYAGAAWLGCSAALRSALQPGGAAPPQFEQAAQASPVDQLRRLRRLILEVDATNSKHDKERILSEFHDLQPLLSLIYDAHSRFYITSFTLKRHLEKREQFQDWQENAAPNLVLPSKGAQIRSRRATFLTMRERGAVVPESLLELLETLKQRRVTGYDALATVTAFLSRNGILAEHEDALTVSDTGDADIDGRESARRAMMHPTLLNIFMRCLDRNLQAGFGEKMLIQAFSNHPASAEAAFDSNDPKNGKGKQKSREDGGKTAPPQLGMKASAFEVALGKSVTRDELSSIFSTKLGDPQSWYASQKLDGIRCIVFVDFDIPLPEFRAEPLVIQSIQTLSRTGRAFTSLDRLRMDLADALPYSPQIRELVEREVKNSPQLCGQRVRIVLDGEVCMMTRANSEMLEIDTLPDGNRVAPSATSSTAAATSFGGLPSSTASEVCGLGRRGPDCVEDFKAISSAIRRKNYTIKRPAFFPFDLLTEREFTQWRGKVALVKEPPKSPKTALYEEDLACVAHRPFWSRVETLQSLLNWCRTHWPRNTESLRRLDQHLVQSASDMEPLVAQSLGQRWEGLMLRHADSIYLGKRTNHLLKLKQWQDAEYRIESVQIAPMRLSINGEYRVCDAVGSVTIRHNGTEVKVGSGLTTKQRVEWAQRPHEIEGKLCTVKYFEESSSMAREKRAASAFASASASAAGGGEGGKKGGAQVEAAGATEPTHGGMSLRFPHIKHVWTKGDRDM
ncbi:hypothetical protein ACQY0O_006663 [Thecaphora frezii]